jgi:hypothetical protein
MNTINEVHLLLFLFIVVGELLLIAALLMLRGRSAEPKVIVVPSPTESADVGCLVLALMPALGLLTVALFLIAS